MNELYIIKIQDMLLTSYDCSYPGEFLLKCMLIREMNAAQLAKELEISTNRLGAILRGKRGISRDTANRLGKVFDTTADFWLDLQISFELRGKDVQA